MTREEDLIRIAKRLDKMVSRNNMDGVLDLLRELKGFNMTLKLLQDTRIGMSVNGIRKHCTDEQAISLAKVLIKNWKRLLESARARKEQPLHDWKNGADSSTLPSSSNDCTPAKTVLEKERIPAKTVLEKERIPTKTMSEKEKIPSKPMLEKDRIPAKTAPEKVRIPPTSPTEEEGIPSKTISEKEMVPMKTLPEKERIPIKTGTEKDRIPPKMTWEKEKIPTKTMFEKERVPTKSLVEKEARKNSSDYRPGHITKRHSSDGKPDRKDSDLNPACSSHAKKLCPEWRDSLGSKSPHAAPLQRKSSLDSYDRVSLKGKADPPKTPTSPTSPLTPVTPLTPPFSPTGGPLAPHLLTGDSIRDKCIEMLSAALRTDDDYKDFGTNCDSMAAEIEDHIYQEIRATDMKYKNRVRSRISNLKDPKNPGLRKNVLAGAIELQRIATMTAEEMASDELKQLRNTLTQEAIREHQMAKTGGTTTDLLQCSKCKKKNCTYNQVQTRSSDEPMTTFVLCNECGNRWKFC